MIPFVHPVSTLQLVRNKFQICKEKAKMPSPTALDVVALVWLLKLKLDKTPAIAAFALRLFLRFDKDV